MTILVNSFIRMKRIYTRMKPTKLIQRIQERRRPRTGYIRFNERQQQNREFNKIDRCVLAEWSRKINRILKHVKTDNVTDTNILIKADIVNVGKKIDVKACGSKNRKNRNAGGKEGL